MADRSKHIRKHLYPFLIILCFFFSIAAGVCASPSAPSFTDVAADAWYADAVAYCQENGLMNGTSEDAYTNAVSWAVASRIISGFPDGSFKGNAPITREQFVAMLWHSAGRPASHTVEEFIDQKQIAPYAQEAVAWARNEGVISGMKNHYFAPKDNTTRAQMAAMLYQWLNQSSYAKVSAENQGEESMPSLTIKVGSETFHATLSDNPTTRALLKQMPFTITMEELNSNEKYYYLPNALPVDAVQPGNIQKGDLMLYGSDCLVLFYESFATSYSYTTLGSVDDASGLADALGNGKVQVFFQVNE